MGVVFLRDSPEYLGEVLEWHVLDPGGSVAVAPAVTAFQRASQGTLPEEILEDMLPGHLLPERPVEFQGQPLLERYGLHNLTILLLLRLTLEDHVETALPQSENFIISGTFLVSGFDEIRLNLLQQEFPSVCRAIHILK